MEEEEPGRQRVQYALSLKFRSTAIGRCSVNSEFDEMGARV